jgi:hypothetical protein
MSHRFLLAGLAVETFLFIPNICTGSSLINTVRRDKELLQLCLS